jgi:hypothetical protein
MNGHKGFQQGTQDVALLQQLAPTPEGFQLGTSRNPTVHLTTWP